MARLSDFIKQEVGMGSSVKLAIDDYSDLPVSGNSLHDIRPVAADQMFYMCVATTGTRDEQWSPISSRKQLEVSTEAPTDTSILWADSSTLPYTLKCYNLNKSAWQSLASSQFQNSVANFMLLPSEDNTVGDMRYVEDDGELYRCTAEAGVLEVIWQRVTNKNHDHNGSYYTIPQVDSKLSQKSASSHAHAASLITTTTPGMSVQSYITNFYSGKEDKTNKGKANGYCELNAYGYVPSNRLPSLNFGKTYVVSSELEQVALAAKPGEVCVRSDQAMTYVQNGGVSHTMSDWTWLQIPAGSIISVNGMAGVVEIIGSDISHDIGTTISCGDIVYSGTTVGALIDELIANKSDRTHLHDDDYYNKSVLFANTSSFRVYEAGDVDNTSPLDTRYYPIDRYRRNGYDGIDQDRPGCGALDDRYFVEQEFFGNYTAPGGGYYTRPGCGVLDGRFYVQTQFFGDYTGINGSYISLPGHGILDSRFYVKEEFFGDRGGVDGTEYDTSPGKGVLDSRYYTKAEVDAQIDAEVAATIENAITGELNMDMRYYNITQLDAGQLDNRYYTKANLNGGQLNNLYYTKPQIDAWHFDSRYYTQTQSGTLYYTKGEINTLFNLDPNYDPDSIYVRRTTTSWQFPVMRIGVPSSAPDPVFEGALYFQGGILYLYQASVWEPYTPQNGTRYILASGTIITYSESLAAWESTIPSEGWFVWEEAGTNVYVHTGGSWIRADERHDHPELYYTKSEIADITDDYYTKAAIDAIISGGINPNYNNDARYYPRDELDTLITSTYATIVGNDDAHSDLYTYIDTNISAVNTTVGVQIAGVNSSISSLISSARSDFQTADNNHLLAGHSSLYYTKTQLDDTSPTSTTGKASVHHSHSGLYYTKSEITTLLSSGVTAPATYPSNQVTFIPGGNVASEDIQNVIYELDAITEKSANKGEAYGYCELDEFGIIPLPRIPIRAVTRVFTATSEMEHIALSAHEGDFCVRTDENKTYVHNTGETGTLTDWTELSVTGSVSGSIGAENILFQPFGSVQANNVQYAIQALINQRGQANGVAGLDALGKVPTSQLPSLVITNISVVATEVEHLALTSQSGDVCVRTDENKTYIHNGGVEGTMADWTQLLSPPDLITSVNGQVGAVELTAADISSTPVSSITATDVQTAIAQLTEAVEAAGKASVVAKTFDYTAEDGDIILADTSASSFIITLPANPVLGYKVTVIDAAGTFAVNNLTIAPNGKLIKGVDESLIVDTSSVTVTLIYYNALNGWVIMS